MPMLPPTVRIFRMRAESYDMHTGWNGEDGKELGVWGEGRPRQLTYGEVIRWFWQGCGQSLD